LGDVIHSLPFLKAVKDTFPQASIEWVISKKLKGILEGNPLISELIVFDKDSWKSIKNLPQTLKDISLLKKTLKTKHYDMVIDLQGLLRSGLIALSAPAPLKIGFANAREGSRYLYDRKVPVNGVSHAVDRYLEVARAIGARVDRIEFPLYIDSEAKERVKRLIGEINEYIIIVPSARWYTKRWPPEYFASLISKLSIPCIITGAKVDEEIARKIIKIEATGHGQQVTENILNLCGKTDLKELVALIAGAKAVVSNDSGPMHIGAALGVPVIALFGPTDPLKTGPYGWQKNRNLKVLRANVSCSPCFKKKCKEPICMSNINVETVFEALREYL